MLDWINRFMSGRYGFDRLGQALAVLAAVCMILAGLFDSKILTAIAYIAAVWCIYRIFSKKIVYRINENRKFNELCSAFSAFTKRDRKTYRYFRCAQCKKTVKVPKGRGKIAITCPHCKNEFIKKT